VVGATVAPTTQCPVVIIYRIPSTKLLRSRVDQRAKWLLTKVKINYRKEAEKTGQEWPSNIHVREGDMTEWAKRNKIINESSFPRFHVRWHKLGYSEQRNLNLKIRKAFSAVQLS
jgi:hypothetical protein